MHYTLKRSKIPNPRNTQYSECPPPQPIRDPKYIVKIVRCGASQKKPPRDSTNSTALGG